MPSTDHRGAPVTLYGLLSDRPRELNDEAVPIDVQAQIDHEVRSGRNVVFGGPPLAVGVQVLLFLGVWVTIWGVFGFPRSLWGIVFMSMVAYAVVAMATLPFKRFLYTKEEGAPIIDAFLRHRRCPACGYDLATSEPGDDGCSPCPECGAAWNVMRERAPSASSG